ncbi:putative methylglyoxal reductase (NADPH-dependent) [Clavispora lusitaniae]|uniref:Methylglyoxal reductase (NADPH-dependent) n=1 Tax=Clavispora lusitaniae TaxID=36911 RepID=A0AA91Q1Y3_CLALS|nr:putative methylglyoxal reductase (NADPH-dependent) [Clavispora lusitaniae]
MTVSEYIFVTGATGFIGAHCVGLLLERNFRVKAHARSQEKYLKLKDSVPQEKRHLLEPAFGSDITSQDELTELMKGCTGVLHLASPFNFAVKDFEQDLLVPALKGTEAVMNAANVNSSIKRVVLTSSFAAVYDASQGIQPGIVLTEDNFSPLTWADGATTTDPAVAYRASKTVAEKAAWDFMSKNSPSFDLCVLCPTMVFGPVYSTRLVSSLSELNFSNQMIMSLLKSSMAEIPPTKNPVWVDVRDLAEYHVAALTEKEASNQRFLISAGDYDNQEIADVLRENLPHECASKVPLGKPGERITGTHYTTDSSKGSRVLKIPYRQLETSVLDLAHQLLSMN